jgi:hypothetical protein
MNSVGAWRKYSLDDAKYQRMRAKYVNGQFKADRLLFHACCLMPTQNSYGQLKNPPVALFF